MGRKIRAFFLLLVMLGCYLPGQARAALPLALIPAVAVGAALALSAGAVGSYYAPAVYDAAHVAASSVGNVARQVYYGQKFTNAVVGDFLYGSAVSLVAHVGDFLDYLGSKASEIPALWAQIQAAISAGGVPPPADIPVGTIMSVPAAQNAVGLNLSTSIFYKVKVTAPFASTNLGCTGVASCTFNQYFTYTGGVVSYVVNQGAINGCNVNFPYCVRFSASFVAATTADPLTEWPPPGFSANGFAADFVPSADIAAEIDHLANDSASPPGFLTPADALPSIAAGGGVAAPAALTQADLDAGLSAVQAAIAADTAAQIAAIAASDPTNPASQIAAAQAAAAAAQAAAEAEKPVEAPYNPTALPAAYAVPAGGFAARWASFVQVIKSTSLFSLPDNFAFSAGAGSSTLEMDFGTLGGVQSVDFADYGAAWAILRSVFLAAFVFISTRIVILKR